MRTHPATSFFFACVLGAVNAFAQANVISYDAFMKQDVNARRAQFPHLTPDNQAVLVREQLVRWRSTNASRLTPEQSQLPDFYTSSSHDDDTKTTFLALDAHATCDSASFDSTARHAYTTMAAIVVRNAAASNASRARSSGKVAVANAFALNCPDSISRTNRGMSRKEFAPATLPG